jgi:hypothetical protein
MSRTRNKPPGCGTRSVWGIVNTGKSKRYAAAVEYFGRAKRCFAVAGLPDCWDQLVD